MDDIIEAVIEIAGELLEGIFSSIKNPRKRKWALTGLYASITLLITGFIAWNAVTLYLEENVTGAVVLAAVAGIVFILFSFFIRRGHKSNW